ncbi:MAG: hypothetical protein KAJ64_04175 [Thermoplasmata archaeon]|nr:hypothetical protein [Thermoplasmata archaeon]
MRRFAVLLIVSIIACVSLAMSVPGQISVANDGPSFVEISIEDFGDMVKVEILIRDLNGWDDIDTVSLKVLDAGGNEISHIALEMYNNPQNPDNLRIEFEEYTGTYLNRDECDFSPTDISPWNPDNTDISIGLNVVFSLMPLEGETIIIEVADTEGETATYEAPMNLNYVSPDDGIVIDENLMILVVIILMLGAIIVVLVLGKHGPKNEF